MPYALREPKFYETQRLAYKAVALARRQGTLVQGPCDVCGASGAEAHHRWGYEAENALRVVWLCSRHHQAEHEDIRRTARAEYLRNYVSPETA